MATGENSGSWGTKTNTNLELIAEAFSYGNEIIGDADTSITMADGASDAARSFFLKITSSASLTTTRVITLAPNTVSKVWMIENATSNGQIITIKQGSGATVNIANGQTKMIATDGGGTGAIVYDLMQDLSVPDLFVDDDLTLQSDGAVLNFGADSDINLTHTADTSLTLGGAGSTTGLLINNTATDGDPFLAFALSGTQVFTMGVDDGDGDKFKIGTTAIGTNTRLTIDSSGNTTFSGTVTATGTSVFASLDISGDIDVDGTTNLDVVDIDGAVDMASTLQLDGAITLGVAGLSNGFINSPSGIFVNIDSDNNQTDRFFDIRKDSTDGSGTLLFQVLESGAATFGGPVTVDHTDGTDNISLTSTSSGGVVNVRDSSGTAKITLDARTSKVGIGTTTVGDKLVVQGDSSATASIVIQDPTADDHGTHLSYDDANSKAIFGGLTNGTKNPALRVARDAASGIDIDSSGNVGIGISNPAKNLEIRTDAGDEGILVKSTGDTSNEIAGDANRTSADAALLGVTGKWNGTSVGQILFQAGADTTNKDDGFIAFRTSSADNITERMRIDSGGLVGINNTSPSSQVAGAADLVIGDTSDADSGMTFVTSTTGQGLIHFSDATSGDARFDGFIGYEQNNRALKFGTAQVERMRIDSSGRVIMGTATDSNAHSNADNLIVGNVPASGVNAGITLVSGDNANGAIHFSDGTASGNANIQGQFIYDHSQSDFLFYTAAAERLKVNATGVTITDGDLIIGTAGHGIDFSAAASGLSGRSNNLLDDYEEGTHDPTVTCSTSGTITVNSSFNTLFYTKVGRLVNVVGRIAVASVSSPVGSIIITLPFGSGDVHDASVAANVSINGIASGDIGDFWAEVDRNQSRIVIYKTGGTSVSSTSAQEMVSGSDIRVMVTYQTQ
jgi:hypothetical protein